MTESPSPEELVAQTELLLHEAKTAGLYLYFAFKGPAEALKSGRAPQGLNLAEQSSFFEECLELLDSAVIALEANIENLRAALEAMTSELTNSEFIEAARAELTQLQGQCEFWQDFLDKGDALVSKFSLICREERLSTATGALVQELWQEVERMASAKA